MKRLLIAALTAMNLLNKLCQRCDGCTSDNEGIGIGHIEDWKLTPTRWKDFDFTTGL